MDLRRVRYFLAVAENLHFGKAAERMNVVQPAISQQIKRFEEELGVELFDRSGNEVRLTEAGRQLLPECDRLVAQAEHAVRVARSANAGTRGRVSFGFVDNSICNLLPPLVREYRRRFPDIELRLESLNRADQAAALVDRTIDVGLTPGPLSDASVESELFISASLVVALPANHRLATLPELRIEQLAEEPFVLFPSAMRTRILEITLSLCASSAFSPNVVQEANQMHTLIALVAAGLGITLVPQWVAGPDSNEIAFRALVGDIAPYELRLGWNRDRRNPAADEFIEVARVIAAELSGKPFGCHHEL